MSYRIPVSYVSIVFYFCESLISPHVHLYIAVTSVTVSFYQVSSFDMILEHLASNETNTT